MKEPNRTCLYCGKPFYAKPSAKRTTCSKECQFAYFKGNSNLITGTKKGALAGNYKGRMEKEGYYLIKVNGHPYADSLGYVREHRYVMEQHLKRYLLPEEEVHHRNRNKKDNNLLNLMLFPDHSTHLKWHSNHPDPEPYLDSPFDTNKHYI